MFRLDNVVRGVAFSPEVQLEKKSELIMYKEGEVVEA